MQHPFEHWTKAEAAHTRLCFFMHATEGTLDCRWNHGPLGITLKTLKVARIKPDTVDGRNPAPADRWFIHVYPTIYRVSTIQGGAGFLPSTLCFRLNNQHNNTIKKILLSVSCFSHHGTCQYMRSLQPPKICKLSVRFQTENSTPNLWFLSFCCISWWCFQPIPRFFTGWPHWFSPCVGWISWTWPTCFSGWWLSHPSEKY